MFSYAPFHPWVRALAVFARAGWRYGLSHVVGSCLVAVPGEIRCAPPIVCGSMRSPGLLDKRKGGESVTLVQRALCSAGARCWAADVKRLKLLAETVRGRYERELRETLPSVLVDALVEGEDHRFYEHIGVDFVGILSALYRYFRFGGTLGGASTIHQQLVRVLTQHRRNTVMRKVREIVLACHLDRNYSKSDIAGMYLTVAYFGWQMNGVAEASKRLSIALPQMSKRQAAALIARLKYPEPFQLSDERSRLIIRRTLHILQLMSFDHGIVEEMARDETVPNV